MPQQKRRARIDVTELDLELLEELERQSLREIRRVRRHERLEIKLDVLVEPANSSDRHRFEARGVTKDLSAGGFRSILPRPARVGDLYRVAIQDGEQYSLPSTFARCLRCQLVREDAFDCSFMFLTPLEAPEIFGKGDRDLLD